MLSTIIIRQKTWGLQRYFIKKMYEFFICPKRV